VSLSEPVRLVPYDPFWPRFFASESDRIRAFAGTDVRAIEHIGSTAVPGLWAKPVIDMMLAVTDEEAALRVAGSVAPLGYQRVDTGMEDRLFLRRDPSGLAPAFHLHIVDEVDWEESHERMMRDRLLTDPEAAEAYAALKRDLAAEHGQDMLAYTRGKTDFIQELIDDERSERGLPLVSVWPD
jgi:GrpB-like predicted nucleotidyltransferase (UPF0157 family)